MKYLKPSYVAKAFINLLYLFSAVQSLIFITRNPAVNQLTAYRTRSELIKPPCHSLSLYEVCKKLSNDQYTNMLSNRKIIVHDEQYDIPDDYDKYRLTITTVSDHTSILTIQKYCYQREFYIANYIKENYREFKKYIQNNTVNGHHPLIKFDQFYESIIIMHGLPASWLPILAGYRLLENRMVLVDTKNRAESIENFGHKYYVMYLQQENDLQDFLASVVKTPQTYAVFDTRLNTVRNSIENNNGYALVHVNNGTIQLTTLSTDFKQSDKIPYLRMLNPSLYKKHPFHTIHERNNYLEQYKSRKNSNYSTNHYYKNHKPLSTKATTEVTLLDSKKNALYKRTQRSPIDDFNPWGQLALRELERGTNGDNPQLTLFQRMVVKELIRENYRMLIELLQDEVDLRQHSQDLVR